MAIGSSGRVIKLVLFFLISLSAFRPSVQLIDEEASGVLENGNVVDVPTRVGCRELIRCIGSGPSDPEWRRFSLRGPLQVGENRRIDTVSMDPDMDGVFDHTTHLLFDPIKLTDTGLFVCIINSVTHTARMRVEPDPATVNANDADISDRGIGTELPVLCSVSTCLSQLTLQLLRGDVVVDSMVADFTAGREAQFNLNISEALVGTYECRALGSFNQQSFISQDFFNITGTPLPPPTMPMPATQGDPNGSGGSSSEGNNPGGPPSSTTQKGSGTDRLCAPALLTLVLLLLLPLATHT